MNTYYYVSLLLFHKYHLYYIIERREPLISILHFKYFWRSVMTGKALSALFFSALMCSQTFGAVSGTVLTPELRPLEGADIHLASNPEMCGTTDEKGNFTLDLLSGTFSGNQSYNKQAFQSNGKSLLFTLPRDEMIKLELFSLKGRKTAILFRGKLSAGKHKLDLPWRKTARQNMLLRAEIGNQTSTFFLSPSGISRQTASARLAKEQISAAKKLPDSLVLNHHLYPRLSVPFDEPSFADTIVAIDSTRGTATDISVDIYCAMDNELVKRIDSLKEGAVVFPVTERDPEYPYGFRMHAYSEGFYTELYNFNQDEVVYLDLDETPAEQGTLSGVLMGKQTYFGNCYARNVTLQIAELDRETQTDDRGRYLFTDVPPGEYTIEFTYQTVQFSFMANTDDGYYHDHTFLEPMQADAPNIYLYPETTSEITLSLSFPTGGNVFLSDPEYGDGWTVTADPTGYIYDTVPYLFYEAKLNGPFVSERGWLIDESSLEEELTSLLTSRGFEGREITDFLEFWIPVLDDAAPYFAVYPQDVESLIEHHVTPEPQSILRELWIIRSLSAPISLPEPQPIEFERNGFTLVEWGVLLSEDLLQRKNQIYTVQ